jgi:hypothetical protein
MTLTANATLDHDLPAVLSNMLGTLDAAAIAPMLVVEGIDVSEMYNVEIDSGLTLVDGDRFECAGNAFWTYTADEGSMSDEAFASVSGRIVDGAPVIERIAVSVQ